MLDVKSLTDEELIRAEFMRRFSTWDIPVDHIDTTLKAVPNEVRQTHYLDLTSILEKPAFKREIDDWKRRVSRVLAMGVYNGQELSAVHRYGLQILLCEIDNFVDTMQKRSALVSPPKPLRAMHEKV